MPVRHFNGSGSGVNVVNGAVFLVFQVTIAGAKGPAPAT